MTADVLHVDLLADVRSGSSPPSVHCGNVHRHVTDRGPEARTIGTATRLYNRTSEVDHWESQERYGISVFANTCHARIDFATRLRMM